MLVDLAVPFDPSVELALADGKPGDKMRERYFCFTAPCPDEIDYGVSGIVGNPDAG